MTAIEIRGQRVEGDRGEFIITPEALRDIAPGEFEVFERSAIGAVGEGMFVEVAKILGGPNHGGILVTWRPLGQTAPLGAA